MAKKPLPPNNSVTTVALDAGLYEKVRAFQEAHSSGEMGRISFKQALAMLVWAGLAAKGAS